MSVKRLFERGAFLYPDRACLVDSHGSLTYRQVEERSRRIVAGLRSLGQVKGDACAVLSANSSLAVEATLSIFMSDGVYVPLTYSNSIADNIKFIQDCEVATLFYSRDAHDKVRAVATECPLVTRYICVDGETNLGASLDSLIAKGEGHEPEVAPMPRPDDVVGIHATGGTTGRSKGVIWTRMMWDTMAANFYAALPSEEPPVYLCVPPITHAAGNFAFLLMAEGSTTIVHPRFDALAVLEAIETHKVTHIYLPPTAIYSLLDQPKLGAYDYSSLKYFIYTSAPMSVPRLKECLAVFGRVMVQFWGQAEAPIFCTVLKPDDHVADGPDMHRLGSCGRPMLMTTVAIMDDAGRLLGPNERGEMVVRGTIVMGGYFKNAEATREAGEFGWHHTGDVGYHDEAGYFYIVDRKKEMIITGGFNVYPAEVERTLGEHASVAECSVIGVPDEKWGEAVKAIVHLRAGHNAEEAELIAFCKGRLGSVKTPKSIEFWDALPRNPVGKVDRRSIRKPYWEGREKVI